MNLEYFREFLMLADTRNYLQAADQLSLSQSTLSRHIAAMEEELGTPLFERTTRRVRPTKAGEAMLPYASSLVTLQYEYSAALLPYTKISCAPVSIGTVPMMPYYGISEILFRYRNVYPELPLRVREDSVDALYEKLRVHQCDYAFILESGRPNPEFARMPFLSDRMVVWLPAAHPLAGKAHVRLDQLQGETLLTLSDYTLLYRLTQKLLQSAGVQPVLRCCGARIESAAAHVAKGEGVCLIMERAAQAVVQSGIRAVPLAPRMAVDLNLVFCRGGVSTPSARHFLDYVSRSRAQA